MVFKNGDKAIVISNLADTDKNYRYSVQPYLDSSKISMAKLYKPDSSIITSYLKKQGNLIQFYDKRVFIFDRNLWNLQLPEKLKADYLYITGNPHTSLRQLGKNFDYQTLVIDGSNTLKLINQLENEAKAMHIKYSVLRRNISVTAVSN